MLGNLVYIIHKVIVNNGDSKNMGLFENLMAVRLMHRTKIKGIIFTNFDYNPADLVDGDDCELPYSQNHWICECKVDSLQAIINDIEAQVLM